MSKNKQGPKGLGELEVLMVPVVEPELVERVSMRFNALPELVTLEQVAGLKVQADELFLASRAILGDQTFEQLKGKIDTMRTELTAWKGQIKNAVLNGVGIAQERARILGVQRLVDRLEEIAREELEKEPEWAEKQKELAAMVAKANRVHELRNAKESLEKEAQSLLKSISA